jgi:hypothetical protein
MHVNANERAWLQLANNSPYPYYQHIQKFLTTSMAKAIKTDSYGIYIGR